MASATPDLYGYLPSFGASPHLHYSTKLGNSPDKLRHTTSVAYLVELVVLNKRQISDGGA